jgi:hypothetical protein
MSFFEKNSQKNVVDNFLLRKLFPNTMAVILRRENCSHTLWQPFSDVKIFPILYGSHFPLRKLFLYKLVKHYFSMILRTITKQKNIFSFFLTLN